jgi:hypothetical protein
MVVVTVCSLGAAGKPPLYPFKALVGVGVGAALSLVAVLAAAP